MKSKIEEKVMIRGAIDTAILRKGLAKNTLMRIDIAVVTTTSIDEDLILYAKWKEDGAAQLEQLFDAWGYKKPKWRTGQMKQ
ncbi:unnamed protein product [Nippostrongylus brasiliensis]|uniref:Transcriptional regulator n=1 Tax=Nippostrongylus brasiliensis TaxID=27835 RepID=A0A0N4YDF2_NIPBR|nr:unnamed protein product [Nippostrongylus brasiliensis]